MNTQYTRPHILPACLQRGIFSLLFTAGLVSPAYSAESNTPADLGVDYAFINLMMLSPDIAAANYTIHNKDGTDVKIAIAQIPYHLELMQDLNSCLQLELAFAYQRSTQIIPTARGKH